MRALLIAGIVILSGSPAWSSGGFSCTTDDASAKFTIESGMSRGAGNGLFNFHGELEIRGNIPAADLRKSQLTQANLMQHWLDGKELKLELYRERGGDAAFAELTLLIETRMVEEGSYEGTYSLRALEMTGDTTGEGQTLEIAGKTSCFVE